MRATVIKPFYDLKDPNHTVYGVGKTYEADTARIKELEQKGFVKIEPEQKAAPKPQRKPKTTKGVANDKAAD